MQGKFQVFGVHFYTASPADLRREVRASAEGNKAVSVIFANAHVVVEANQNPEFIKTLRNANIVVPDGTPISWVLRAKGQVQTQRYSGPDFMEDIFFEAPKARHFFLGSTPETLEKIKTRFKGHAVGFYSPPFSVDGFSEEEKQKHLKIVEDADADFIWVGLGAPKQEKYVVEMASRAKRGVWLAVGAAFDFYAGNKPRAPKTLQRLGLEWAFRMATEPRRLSKRYFTSNPIFIKMALKEILQKSPQSTPQSQPQNHNEEPLK